MATDAQEGQHLCYNAAHLSAVRIFDGNLLLVTMQVQVTGSLFEFVEASSQALQ